LTDIATRITKKLVNKEALDSVETTALGMLKYIDDIATETLFSDTMTIKQIEELIKTLFDFIMLLRTETLSIFQFFSKWECLRRCDPPSTTLLTHAHDEHIPLSTITKKLFSTTQARLIHVTYQKNQVRY